MPEWRRRCKGLVSQCQGCGPLGGSVMVQAWGALRSIGALMGSLGRITNPDERGHRISVSKSLCVEMRVAEEEEAGWEIFVLQSGAPSRIMPGHLALRADPVP